MVAVALGLAMDLSKQSLSIPPAVFVANGDVGRIALVGAKEPWMGVWLRGTREEARVQQRALCQHSAGPQLRFMWRSRHGPLVAQLRFHVRCCSSKNGGLSCLMPCVMPQKFSLPAINSTIPLCHPYWTAVYVTGACSM